MENLKQAMTDSQRLLLEERFKLRGRAIELLDLVVNEWDSDPMSVRCFDLRIVKESKAVTKRIKEIDAEF